MAWGFVCLHAYFFLRGVRFVGREYVNKHINKRTCMHARRPCHSGTSSSWVCVTFPLFLFCFSIHFSMGGTLVFCLVLRPFSSIAYIRCIFSTGGGVGRMYFYERVVP